MSLGGHQLLLRGLDVEFAFDALVWARTRGHRNLDA
jgi:hypothetical protein